jgi:hypothetical protein
MTWLANPVLFLSWIAVLRSSREVSIYLSLAALALSAMFLLARTVVGEKGPLDITCVGRGYWLWLASTVAVGIAAFVTSPSVASLATVPEHDGPNT